MYKFNLCGVVFTFLFVSSNLLVVSDINAAPVNYTFDAAFNTGTVGVDAAGLTSAMDANIFGAASGLMSYDSDSFSFLEDIYGSTDGGNTFITVGHRYNVTGSVAIELADGTVLSSNGFGVDVITEPLFFPGFTLKTEFSIPDSIWVNDTAPQLCGTGNPGTCWTEWGSFIGFAIAGTANGALPPSDLSGASGVGYGGLCGDADENGIVNQSTECVELLLGANNLNAVPIPAAIWLFGTGLLGLIGIARRKKV